MSSSATSGVNVSTMLERRRPVVRDANDLAPDAQHLGRAARRRLRCRPRSGRAGPRDALAAPLRPLRRRAGEPAADSGRNTRNSLPRPRPSLRASTLPPCSSTSDRTIDEAEAEAALRTVERLPLLDEQVEHPGQHRGRMPMPVSRTADARALALAPARDRDRDRSRGVYFAALVSRFANTCASRSGSPSTTRPGGTSTARRCARCSSSGLASSIALLDHLREVDPAGARATTIPRVMRETSSRSSTRRTTCSTCRSMIARSFAKRLGVAQLHQLERGEDRRERIAQLVAEQGQELVLGAVARLRLLAGLDLRGHVALRAPRAPQPAVLDHAHQAAAEDARAGRRGPAWWDSIAFQPISVRDERAQVLGVQRVFRSEQLAQAACRRARPRARTRTSSPSRRCTRPGARRDRAQRAARPRARRSRRARSSSMRQMPSVLWLTKPR